mmetsp:Transcript_5053/g.23259  ORF Transcript_5053/g.23259 Transcript_5053/m.23259 type:complete len:288 (-) Transcript_5053:697-1560(-)
MAFVVTSISVPGGSLSCICMLYDLGMTSGGRGSTARSISAIAACQLPWQIISESITPVETMPGRPWYSSPTVTTLRRALGEASAHRGSLSSTLKDLSPRPAVCALPQTKHCECSSYEAWMDIIGLPSTSGMPASAAGCFGELQGLTSWPSCTKRAHSSRERNAWGVAWNARRVVVVVVGPGYGIAHAFDRVGERGPRLDGPTLRRFTQRREREEVHREDPGAGHRHQLVGAQLRVRVHRGTSRAHRHRRGEHLLRELGGERPRRFRKVNRLLSGVLHVVGPHRAPLA